MELIRNSFKLKREKKAFCFYQALLHASTKRLMEFLGNNFDWVKLCPLKDFVEGQPTLIRSLTYLLSMFLNSHYVRS